jgi:hypothetical protein
MGNELIISRHHFLLLTLGFLLRLKISALGHVRKTLAGNKSFVFTTNVIKGVFGKSDKLRWVIPYRRCANNQDNKSGSFTTLDQMR